jgi:hypothetical protein
MCPRFHTTIYYCTRVHILQGTEDLDALTPDKDLYDVIHTSTRPLPPYSTHPTDSTDSKDLAADVQAAKAEEEAAAAAQHAWSPGMSAEEEGKKKEEVLARALRLASASANLGEDISSIYLSICVCVCVCVRVSSA